MSRVVKLVMIGLVVFLVYSAIDGGYESRSSPSPDEAVVEVTEPREDPAPVRSSKLKVDAVVRKFVRVYFLRDRQVFAEGTAEADERYEALLSPLVTAEFMDTYLYTLDIPQNQVFVDGSLEQKARVKKMSYHGHLEADEADRSALVEVSLFRQGEPLRSRTTSIEFLLEKQGDVWLIAGCTCDS
jgi:hypothetical protein